ncbi:MAG: DUF1501 domain-containing protein [Planctomycetaceae bacterium]
MSDFPCRSAIHHQHAFMNYYGMDREGLTVVDRRSMLKAGLAGIAGLCLPELIRTRAEAADAERATSEAKSVILLWMAGGPSQIDMWDVKPDRPDLNRGPFDSIPTKLTDVRICEHLPKQAAMLDKFTLIRSVDAQFSNHRPNNVFQTGNLDANSAEKQYPAIGSVIAKLRGSNHPSMPPYVATSPTPRKDIAPAGSLGKRYDPFIANNATKLPIFSFEGEDTGKVGGGNLFELPAGLSIDRLHSRQTLLSDFDRLRENLDLGGSMESANAYQQQAVEMVAGGRAQSAFDLSCEPAENRERYGKHLWCQQALLARRLVEAGVTYVTVGLTYGGGADWDHHGDQFPPYGGINNGLRRMLPVFDHLLSTLVTDLEERGLLDKVLVLALGEFGRTPIIGTQEGPNGNGRNHWPPVMSMALAGGGLRHGQVIGATDAAGGAIKDRAVTPPDLAATIYRYMDVPLDATYLDNRGRPHYIIQNNGQPIRELF